MKYKYMNTGAFYSGLPAQDLDDANLTDVQKDQLAFAVANGDYKPAAQPAPTPQPAPDPSVSKKQSKSADNPQA